ncbi:MAG: YdcF family protein [Bacteroidales bacterium]|nr:YdcF family protein [Bacteroidales bacterium]
MRKFLRCLFLLCLLVLGFIIFCNVSISQYAKSKLYDSVDEIPYRRAALVLGTSPRGRNGGPNRFYMARINACVELFEANKVDRIIVSGDNRHTNYNEPEAMRRSLVERGIPDEVIFLDYAGFRTFDSVVRAHEVFRQPNFIVVSQKFHNERAVFIAGKKGIEAFGYNAEDVGFNYGLMTYIRECFARCKVYIDLITGKQPHFLGDPVDVG